MFSIRDELMFYAANAGMVNCGYHRGVVYGFDADDKTVLYTLTRFGTQKISGISQLLYDKLSQISFDVQKRDITKYYFVNKYTDDWVSVAAYILRTWHFTDIYFYGNKLYAAQWFLTNIGHLEFEMDTKSRNIIVRIVPPFVRPYRTTYDIPYDGFYNRLYKPVLCAKDEQWKFDDKTCLPIDINMYDKVTVLKDAPVGHIEASIRLLVAKKYAMAGFEDIYVICSV